MHIDQVRARFMTLLKHPLFWVLTLIGNATILLGGCSLYFFESPVQRAPLDFDDALLWALGMVTTVGYGHWTAISLGGKVTSAFLMLGGTLFVWSYMAFLVTGLITPELNTLETDVRLVEEELHEMRSGKLREPL